MIQWGVCFHVIFYHSRSIRYLLVVSPVWKATYDFRASSSRTIRIISANVLVVVLVCLHSHDGSFLFSIRVSLFFWSAFFPLQVEPSEFGLISFHFLSSSQPLWVGRLVGCVNVCVVYPASNKHRPGHVLFVLSYLFFWKEARGKAVVELWLHFSHIYVCMSSFEKNESCLLISCLFFSFFASFDGHCVIFIKTVSRNYMHGHMSRSYVYGGDKRDSIVLHL